MVRSEGSDNFHEVVMIYFGYQTYELQLSTCPILSRDPRIYPWYSSILYSCSILLSVFLFHFNISSSLTPDALRNHTLFDMFLTADTINKDPTGCHHVSPQNYFLEFFFSKKIMGSFIFEFISRKRFLELGGCRIAVTKWTSKMNTRTERFIHSL